MFARDRAVRQGRHDRFGFFPSTEARVPGSRHEARSAGSEPGAHAHPLVVEALKEIGIDASDHVPRLLDEERIQWSDQIVSTCQEEVCPVTFGKPRTSWEFPDPKDRPLEEVRQIRDEIRERVEELLADLDAKRPSHDAL